MIEIKDLLLKFNNLFLKEELKTEAVRTTISGVIGLDIKPEDIKIKKGVVYLNIKPIYKNEILLKREEIFKKLNETITTKTIDIR